MPHLRTLPSSCLAGDWQMAIDGWLLEQRAPAFRLYRWQRPTLSLGFHQHHLEPHWGELAAGGLIELVRRPSGGRAVLHAGEITYALVWPDAPRQHQQAYVQACGWLLDAFASLGLPLEPGSQAASLQRSNCFASSTAADLVHAGGAKRIGSAQLWRQGCLLQHGSILVEPPAELWQLVFGADPPALPDLPLNPDELEALLQQCAAAALPTAAAGVLHLPLSAAEWARIATGRAPYRVNGSTPPLASPEASIERTT
ncbi:lipoate--protein ligase family protein [Cyanobium sp. Aljojuca 7D2]|uniref:lipoyl protein ligase domain-containing protein n=1 Tax=Cyanobium sp. Aljojuca 7D2 TaxID=2823698 RepID=UPI0020CDBB22|nr:lipoate--protein ligase family protein [Cyanobium sp. Aljojuca 7D2]MCP9891871.1 lipoate--protein ligase family protein [Cyanobium sp. Aljojuca 7D2]